MGGCVHIYDCLQWKGFLCIYPSKRSSTFLLFCCRKGILCRPSWAGVETCHGGKRSRLTLQGEHPIWLEAPLQSITPGRGIANKTVNWRFQSCKYQSWCLKAAGKFTWQKQTPLLCGQCFDERAQWVSFSFVLMEKHPLCSVSLISCSQSPIQAPLIHCGVCRKNLFSYFLEGLAASL